MASKLPKPKQMHDVRFMLQESVEIVPAELLGRVETLLLNVGIIVVLLKRRKSRATIVL